MIFRSVASVIVLLIVMFSTVSIALADALYWSAKAPMPTPRSRGASGVVNGKIYVLGGENASVLATVEVYDPVTNSWSAMDDMVHSRFAAASAVHGPSGMIYIVGGSGGAGATNTVIRYNTADGTSSVVGNITTARFRASCAIVGDNLYVFGGSTTGAGANAAIDSGEVYSLTSNTVIDTFTLPQPLTLASVVRVGAKIYMIGGLTSGLVPIDNCWEFDPATKSFTPKAAMPTARGGIKGVAFSSGKIYVIGGVTSTGLPPTSYTAYVQEYDPSGNTWSLKGSMATKRYAAMGGVVNDVLHVIGGDNGSALAVNESAYLQGGTTDVQGSFLDSSSTMLSGAKLTFPSAATGLMAVSIGNTGPAAAPAGVSFRGQYYDISTSALFSGNLTVTIPYDEGSIVGPAASLKLYHWNGSSWEGLSTSVDTNAKTISGVTSSLSPFVVGEQSGGGGSASGFGMNTNILLALAAILMLSGIGLMRARRSS
jgi:N-acetylneuraminic acid mutarotase